MFRNIKDDKAYTLKVGNLSDIVELVLASQIQKKLLNMYKPCIPAFVEPQISGFKGDVRRKEFKEKMYAFDDSMGYIMMTT